VCGDKVLVPFESRGNGDKKQEIAIVFHFERREDKDDNSHTARHAGKTRDSGITALSGI